MLSIESKILLVVYRCFNIACFLYVESKILRCHYSFKLFNFVYLKNPKLCCVVYRVPNFALLSIEPHSLCCCLYITKHCKVISFALFTRIRSDSTTVPIYVVVYRVHPKLCIVVYRVTYFVHVYTTCCMTILLIICILYA